MSKMCLTMTGLSHINKRLGFIAAPIKDGGQQEVPEERDAVLVGMNGLALHHSHSSDLKLDNLNQNEDEEDGKKWNANQDSA